ncbi:hypothetical protein HGRIS_006176 [Hohenbuehelia grisea]|uniref:Arginyl-tRNA synthetase catalytic core domain-containing protein n=1 Tax=Hohenbuehelia grisea TaxID=104357 RepID=A0ABR3K187_9AGAR
MGEPCADKLEHINFGKVQGMSTRNGEVKFLEEILDMAKEAMLVQMKSNADKFNNVEDPDFTSDQIGMTCVKVQDMQAKRFVPSLRFMFASF